MGPRASSPISMTGGAHGPFSFFFLYFSSFLSPGSSSTSRRGTIGGKRELGAGLLGGQRGGEERGRRGSLPWVSHRVANGGGGAVGTVTATVACTLGNGAARRGWAEGRRGEVGGMGQQVPRTVGIPFCDLVWSMEEQRRRLAGYGSWSSTMEVSFLCVL